MWAMPFATLRRAGVNMRFHYVPETYRAASWISSNRNCKSAAPATSVLSFESDLRNAESASIDALIAYLNAKTRLDQILGTTLESWDIALND